MSSENFSHNNVRLLMVYRLYAKYAYRATSYITEINLYRRTNRQTDRQTDRQTELPTPESCPIACSSLTCITHAMTQLHVIRPAVHATTVIIDNTRKQSMLTVRLPITEINLYRRTNRQTDRQTDRIAKFSNSRCPCARGLIIMIFPRAAPP